jgi:tRNA pseudouridine32 synthase / 23S rRNA pseudouridine746 synthase
MVTVSDWARLRRESVIAEDAAILALNKPAGIAVTGERHGTDLVKMAGEAGERLFPVHRIDKATSGLILFARDLRWHGGMTRQFAKGGAGKGYLVITALAEPGAAASLPATGTIDLPLSVGRKNRVRVAAPRASIVADQAAGTWSVGQADVFGHVRTYPSVTRITTLWAGERHAVLLARPLTGRRHQIRVHLAWTGFGVLGDSLFGGASSPRAYLHSLYLSFAADWRDGARLELTAPPGRDFWEPVLGELPGQDPSALLGAAREALTAMPGPA